MIEDNVNKLMEPRNLKIEARTDNGWEILSHRLSKET